MKLAETIITEAKKFSFFAPLEFSNQFQDGKWDHCSTFVSTAAD